MSRKIRYILLGLNIIGIVVAWFIPRVIWLIHYTDAYSIYHEFEDREFINTEKVEAWREKPGEENYSIDKRMQDVGNLRAYLPMMSSIMIVLFALNEIVLLISLLPIRRRAIQNKNPPKN